MIMDSFTPHLRVYNFQFTMIIDLFTSHLLQFTWIIDLFTPNLRGVYNFLIYFRRGMSKSIIKKDLSIGDNKL